MAYSLTECIKIRADKKKKKGEGVYQALPALLAHLFPVVAVATSCAQRSLGPILLRTPLSILSFGSATSLPVSHRTPEETLLLTRSYI